MIFSKNRGKGSGFLKIGIKNHAKSRANTRKRSCNPLHKRLKNHIDPPKSRYNARVRAKSSRWPSVSILTRLTPPLPCIFMMPQ